jgi:hypothetical protein
MVGRLVGSGGAVGVLVVVVGAALGCGGGAGADTAATEKVAAQSAALIQGNPTPPYTFPVTPPVLNSDGVPEYDCRAIAPTTLLSNAAEVSPTWLYKENYYAYPVKDFAGDPGATTYSHTYTYNECTNPESLNCQLAHDFFGIANANGYKYLVAQISYSADKKALVQSTRNWYLEGVGAVNQGWQWDPWNAGGNGKVPWCMDGTCAAGPAFFDNNSHPPYGQGAVQADWLSLWNLAWTYSWGTPQDGTTPGPYNKTIPNTSGIESTHHQCSFVYVCAPGASCINPSTGTAFLSDGMTFYNPRGLAAQDFFFAAEKHDPSCAGGCQ